MNCDGGCGRRALPSCSTCGRESCQIAALHAAIKFVEQTTPLPRCQHGHALRDGAGEILDPSCGCADGLPRS
jgi:hypothetical protein